MTRPQIRNRVKVAKMKEEWDHGSEGTTSLTSEQDNNKPNKTAKSRCCDVCTGAVVSRQN
jgi:hypothetical protein